MGIYYVTCGKEVPASDYRTHPDGGDTGHTGAGLHRPQGGCFKVTFY
jgi:hypothetical protein